LSKAILHSVTFLLFVGCGGDGNVNLPEGIRIDSRPNIIVVITDDQGFADVGAQDVFSEVQTPHIDRMAQHGVRMTAAYSTAPQCTPSRAALMTGRYQQRFGVEDNMHTPLPLSTDTIAQRLRHSGYFTGFVGKWHLDVDNNSRKWFATNFPSGDVDDFDVNELPIEIRRRYFPDSRGFDDVYFGYKDSYWRNFNFFGRDENAGYVTNRDFRIHVVTNAALSFIDRHRTDPFFLVVSYYAPHVPLEAPSIYLDRIAEGIPLRRRYALAMILAVDSGVGAIMEKVRTCQLEEDTLIFFMSDNGAPLGIDKMDAPISDPSGMWDGSLNDPWIGEKGMLSEGGIRVPFLVQWKGTLPENEIYHGAVSMLDVGMTALSVAESLPVDDLDGMNLVPILQGNVDAPMERTLFWRFWNQMAIRKGSFKFLLAGGYEFLFDLSDPDHEYVNLIEDQPDIAMQMKDDLSNWAQSMQRPRMTKPQLTGKQLDYYKAYFGVRAQ